MNSLRRFLALVVVAGLLAACGGSPVATTTETQAPQTAATPAAETPTTPATTEPAAESTESPTDATTPAETATAGGTAAGGGESEAEMIAGMQETLDLYNAAYNEGDKEKLLAAIEPKKGPFQRVSVERFETAMESQFGGMYNLQDKISEIRDRGNGYYEATVLTQPRLSSNAEGQAIRKMVFKKVDDRWVLTEPTRAELGKKLKYETDRFTIDHYEWDQNIVEEMGRLMENAYATVQTKLGKMPEGRMYATLLPTYESAGVSGGNWLAYYSASASAVPTPQRPDRIVLRSPQSIGFGAYDAKEGFGPFFQGVITHEFTHLVTNRAFGGNARLGGGFSWMSEGIADHVAGLAGPGQIMAAFASDSLIPLQDKSGAIEKQDLEHIYLLETDRSLGYAQGYELVDFIYTEKGGYEGWWKFVDAYDDRQSLEDAVRSEFGMTVEEFEAAYMDFMKKKYNIS